MIRMIIMIRRAHNSDKVMRMNLSESLTVELKEMYTDDIRKTVIAFANTAGGCIYIGIADDGRVVGVDNSDEVMLRASDAVRDSIRPDVTVFTSYHIDKINDKNVVVIEVLKGTACPYYLESKGIRPGGVYVRQGASSVPASSAAILKMIKETDGDSYEAERCTNQTLTFEYAESEFKRAGVEFGITQKKTLKILNDDNMYTRLAELLSDQCLHTIKSAAFDGTEKLNFKDRAEFGGSVLKQVNDAYDYIDRFNRTRSEFEGIYRIDKRDYPVEAVREALLNAVVHRDYSFSGSILVSVFDDRIEIISIGGLVKGISYDDMMLGVSIQRNERLANVFYRLNLIESFGTGIKKIMDCYKGNYVQPEINVSENAFKITLPNINYSSGISVTSEPREQMIMDLLNKRGTVTRKDVEQLLDVSQATAARILKKMTLSGVLSSMGNGKNMKYVNNGH